MTVEEQILGQKKIVSATALGSIKNCTAAIKLLHCIAKSNNSGTQNVKLYLSTRTRGLIHKPFWHWWRIQIKDTAISIYPLVGNMNVINMSSVMFSLINY